MNKKWPYFLTLIILIFVGFFLYNRYRVPPTVDMNTLGLTSLDNQPVTFSKLKGKKTIVCFSASWCPNCLNELRELNSIKNSDLSDVNIVVISDEPFEKVQAWAERTAYPFTFMKMSQSFPAIGIHSIPVTYLMNDRQEVTKVATGYMDWTDPSTREHLKKMMDN